MLLHLQKTGGTLLKVLQKVFGLESLFSKKGYGIFNFLSDSLNLKNINYYSGNQM